MNKFKTLAERREAVRQLVAYELHLLKNEAHNPITKTRVLVSVSLMNKPVYWPSRTGLFKMKVEAHTREDAASVLRYVKKRRST